MQSLLKYPFSSTLEAFCWGSNQLIALNVATSTTNAKFNELYSKKHWSLCLTLKAKKTHNNVWGPVCNSNMFLKQSVAVKPSLSARLLTNIINNFSLPLVPQV